MPGFLAGPVSGFMDRMKGKGMCSSSFLNQVGKGAALSAGGGSLAVFSSVAGVGNGADTTEDTLFTATIPANTFDIPGRQLLLEAFGSISATNAVKTVRVYFGTSIVYAGIIVTPAAVTAGDWQAQLLVTKTANNVQIAVAAGDFSGAAAVRSIQKFLTGSEADTAGIVVKITGQSSVATANTVLCNQLTISGYN